MSDEMKIAHYLSEGGKLSNPSNVPPRYRAELLKLMATFVDSELAGAAGFADMINHAPGIRERISAARIVLEKTDHAGRVLHLMGEFGADTDRYVRHHPWTARLPRDTPVGTERSEHDMRLSVLNYPLTGWADAVVMNLLMGLAVAVQLEELQAMSYQPLASVLRDIAPAERHHTALAQEGIALLLKDNDNRAQVTDSVTYWWPRVEAVFGGGAADRFAQLKDWGLRQQPNNALKARWTKDAKAALAAHDLTPPAKS